MHASSRRLLTALYCLPFAALAGIVGREVVTDSVPAARRAAQPVAVVDLTRALAAYQPYSAGVEDLKALVAEYRAAEDDLRSEIENLGVEIQVAAGEALREKKLLSLLKRNELEGRQQLHQNELQIQELELNVRCYTEIQPLIADFCKRLEIEVLLRRRPWEPSGQNVERDFNLSLQREVLYHAPRADVTDKLVNFLKGAAPKEGNE